MRNVLPLALALLATAASAQGRLAFDAESADFGRVAEADGPVTHAFRFTNAGDAPLRLVGAEANCGCTTPTWSRDEVAPGGTGVVEVAFDPAGRPGPFERSVFVRAEGAAPVALRIEGVVRPALADEGERLGAFAFDRVEADLGRDAFEGGVQAAFRYANASARPVRIDSVSAPEGVRVVAPTRPVFPDDVAGLFVSAEHVRVGRLTSGHGFEIDVVLHTDDPEMPDKRVRVVGTVDLVVPPREVRIQDEGR